MTLSVVNPICEYRKNPLGIDITQPRLSWQLASDRRGVKQTVYQILAASSPEPSDTRKHKRTGKVSLCC